MSLKLQYIHSVVNDKFTNTGNFSFTVIIASTFRYNRADINRGVTYSSHSSMSVEKCIFLTNSASVLGGVINAVESSIVILLINIFQVRAIQQAML